MARPEIVGAPKSAVTYRGLRDWMEQVEKLGELQKVNGAHWDREMGAITQMLTEGGKGKAPAVLFDEVPGYPKGYRTLYGQFSTIRRVALTLGLPLEYERKSDIVKAYHHRHGRHAALEAEICQDRSDLRKRSGRRQSRRAEIASAGAPSGGHASLHRHRRYVHHAKIRTPNGTTSAPIAARFTTRRLSAARSPKASTAASIATNISNAARARNSPLSAVKIRFSTCFRRARSERRLRVRFCRWNSGRAG